MTEEQIIKKINELISNLACCDRDGCRCYQAKLYLKQILDFCKKELEINEVQ